MARHAADAASTGGSLTRSFSGSLAAALAALSLGLVLCPMPWLWLGMGLAILAVTAGWTTYRHAELPGWTRLLGAASSSVALLAVVLATTRVALSLAAVSELERLLH